MSNVEEAWRRRTDDQLVAAAQRIEEYTDEGRQVIREELRRRAIAEPSSVSEPEELNAGSRIHTQRNVFGKVALTALAWLVTTLVSAAAIEITFGRARPGFVPLTTVPLLAPTFVALWWPRSPVPRLVREYLWATGCALAFAILAIAIVVSGLESARPRADDWLAGVVAVYVFATAVRVVRWALRNGTIVQQFVRAYWPDFVIVIGVEPLGFTNPHQDRF